MKHYLHRDEEMPQTFPQKPCKYQETEQTRLARTRQQRIWRKYTSTGADITFNDVTKSASTSHVLMTSQSHSGNSAESQNK